MQFSFRQAIEVDVEQALSALANESYYAGLEDLGPLGSPSVVSVERGASTVVSVRWRFEADLPSAARAALDPDRLTWVIRTTFTGPAATFEVLPDNYADLLRCSGAMAFTSQGAGCVQDVSGELKVRFPLVGGKVERVIAEGLEEHVAAEAKAIARFAAGS